MQPLIYDVAVSIDGYIAGPSVGNQPDISRFPHTGSIVEDYLTRLAGYDVCLMGRGTYEFGYSFGLKPGENPYPAMRSIVISESIDLPDEADIEIVRGDASHEVRRLKTETRAPIYLCGGGVLAASLLACGLIDRLRLKRAPVLLGGGVPLFADNAAIMTLKLMNEKRHDNGAVYQEYAVS